jgi:hypothetical protein
VSQSGNSSRAAKDTKATWPMRRSGERLVTRNRSSRDEVPDDKDNVVVAWLLERMARRQSSSGNGSWSAFTKIYNASLARE